MVSLGNPIKTENDYIIFNLFNIENTPNKNIDKGKDPIQSKANILTIKENTDSDLLNNAETAFLPALIVLLSLFNANFSLPLLIQLVKQSIF